MLHCSIFPENSLKPLKYTVVICRMGGQWLFTRHPTRQTWETAGGHIEPGESALDCARRELYEETGALEFDIAPVFDYHGWDRLGASDGQVFFAQIRRLGPLPENDMAEVRLFDELPDALTYPLVTPVLARRALAAVRAGEVCLRRGDWNPAIESPEAKGASS